MSASVFTKIINRDVSAHFLYEDEHCVVILDKFPVVKGQALVIPKKEIAYLFDLDDDTYLHLFKIAKRIGTACDKALNAERTCLVVEGFDVPHVHIKMYPMPKREPSLGTLLHAGVEETEANLTVVATQIQAALED